MQLLLRFMYYVRDPNCIHLKVFIMNNEIITCNLFYFLYVTDLTEDLSDDDMQVPCKVEK